MIYRVKERWTKEKVLGILHPLLREWFSSRFDALTEPQEYAIPLIHNKRSVLVSSPTGSGKTLTAFLSIINELYLRQVSGSLEDEVFCVYVSPLKALANDIRRNLMEPLEEMRALAEKRGLPPPEIRVSVRSGDTSSYERSKMARRPPHILITTPESLSLILTSPKFGKRLDRVQYLIVDEIHELCSSKRGTLLSLNMERLEERNPGDVVRIGLSATQAPIEEIAAFLAGYPSAGSDEPRDVGIVEVSRRKELDLRVLCPVDDMTSLPFEVVNERMYDLLVELINQHTTTLIFTNTRRGAEAVAFKLQERGVESIAAHHGSLSKDTRFDVEERLKRGELKAVVSSTSLELGIDIGSIDLVCQIGSPKSIAKGLQRIGRAGHSVFAVPKGRFVVFENDDLVECAVLARYAKEGRIDRVTIPRNNLDILAQTLVGMSQEKRWHVDEAYELVKRSYSFHTLSKDDFLSVLAYLGEREADYAYSKLWYDPEEGVFGRKKGVRMIYYLNAGAIAEESNYEVFTLGGKHVGSLSEKFVERLTPGDVFVLGGSSYEYVRTRGMRVFVKDSPGRKPTIPSWMGEMLPRSFDLSTAVGRFRRVFGSMIKRGESDERLMEYLTSHYYLDEGSARTIINYFREQVAFDSVLPTDRRWVVEGYIDGRGRYSLIFHTCHGRRVHDALSRAYALAISNRYGCSVSVSINDDAFMLTFSRRIPPEEVIGLVTSANIEDLLREAIRSTELFKQRFRHCANRAFLVLKNYRGKEISMSRQQSRAEKIMRILEMERGGYGEEHPVVREAYNEILNEVMDLPHARQVLEEVERGERGVHFMPYSDVPSPFAHGIVLAGISDIVLMEDRGALLKELHRKVLEKIMPSEKVRSFVFSPEEVRAYFDSKRPVVKTAGDILRLLAERGPHNLLQHKGDNIYAYASDPDRVRRAALDLIKKGAVVSLWMRDLVWSLPEEAPFYTALLAEEIRPGGVEKDVLALLEKAGKKGVVGEKIVESLARMGRSKNEVLEALKILERVNKICRIGIVGLRAGEDETGALSQLSFVFALRPSLSEKDKKLLDGFVEKDVKRVLGARGPMTREEIAYWTGIDVETLDGALRRLVDRGEVESGWFVVGDDIQYMLSSDVARLKYGEKAYTEKEVREALWLKHMSPLKSVDEYFSRYGLCGYPQDIYPRCGLVGVKEWKAMRKRGEILEGRFDNGRVAYVLKKDAHIYVACFRKEGLSESEKEVLEFIKKEGNASLDTLKREFQGRNVKEALENLDRNLYVYRKYTGEEGWTSRKTYAAMDEDVEREAEKCDLYTCSKEIVRRFIKAHGPVPETALRYSGVVRSMRKRAVGDLLREGVIERVYVGREKREYLVTKEDRRFLEKAREHPGVSTSTSIAPPAPPFASSTASESGRDDHGIDHGQLFVLSLYDPYLQPMWGEINARYGDRWIFPLVYGGEIVGAVEKWDMAGFVEIREVEVEPRFLAEEWGREKLADALYDQWEYHRAMGVDVLRIKEINGKSASDISGDVKEVFEKRGFLETGEIFVIGPVVTETFDMDTLIRYVLFKQHLPPNTLEDTMSVVMEQLGVRGDEEVGIRASWVTPLDNYVKDRKLWIGRGIPALSMYMTMEQAGFYQAVRGRRMGQRMGEIYRLIKMFAPATRDQIINASPLGEAATRENLKKLFEGGYLVRTKNSAYFPVPIASEKRREARKEFIKHVFKQFGVFTAADLNTYLRGEFRMKEIRQMLDELVQEGYLVKGFLCSERDELFWMLAEDLNRVENMQSSFTGVVERTDRLAYYLAVETKKRFGLGSSNLVFVEGKLEGAFVPGKEKWGKKHSEQLIKEFRGTERANQVAREYMRKKLREHEDLDDWEIMEWYERYLHPKFSS